MAEYYLAYEVPAEPDQIPADYAEYIARSVERGFADTIFEQLESGEKIFTLDPFVTKFRPETMSTQWKQKLTVQDLVRCKDCIHFHEDVFGDEIGLGKPYDNLIVGHNGCGRLAPKGDMIYVSQEGFCFLAEKKWED